MGTGLAPSAHPTPSALDSLTSCPAVVPAQAAQDKGGFQLWGAFLSWALWVRREAQRCGGLAEGRQPFILAYKANLHPQPELAHIGMHHKSSGCCSCDWIIYSSSLTFPTRKYHTKRKVVQSHLSPMPLTPDHRAFQKPRAGMREAGYPLHLSPSLPPAHRLLCQSLALLSHISSDIWSSRHILARSLSLFLSHTFPHRCGLFCSVAPSFSTHLVCPPDVHPIPLPFASHHQSA